MSSSDHFIQSVPNNRQRLVCCTGRQTDYFSRRSPCPEPHDLGAVEHRSVRSTYRQYTEHVQHFERLHYMIIQIITVCNSRDNLGLFG